MLGRLLSRSVGLSSAPSLLRSSVVLRPLASAAPKKDATTSSTPKKEIYPGLTAKLHDGITPGGIAHNYKLQHLSSYALLGLLPVGLAGVNPGGAVDLALAVVIPLHFHIGMSQVITDYIHMEGVYKVLTAALALLTLGTSGAMVSLSVNDIGFTGVIRAIWGDKTVTKKSQ